MKEAALSAGRDPGRDHLLGHGSGSARCRSTLPSIGNCRTAADLRVDHGRRVDRAVDHQRGSLWHPRPSRRGNRRASPRPASTSTTCSGSTLMTPKGWPAWSTWLPPSETGLAFRGERNAASNRESACWRGDQEILKGIDLQIERGQIHAIMGPNGSGKSTLANVLMGHPDYRVTAGTIEFLGEDLTAMTPDERAAKGTLPGLSEPRGDSGGVGGAVPAPSAGQPHRGRPHACSNSVSKSWRR